MELALLHERGQLVLPADVSSDVDLKPLLIVLALEVLLITPEIALLSRSKLFQHGCPADRLIGATALKLSAEQITADATLRALPELNIIWYAGQRLRGAQPPISGVQRRSRRKPCCPSPTSVSSQPRLFGDD